MNKSEQLQNIVKLSEQYIEENAMKILNCIEERNNKTIKEYITYYYKPQYTLEELKAKSEQDLKKILLGYMCHELQNYQVMPKAINFAGNKDEILKIVNEQFNGTNLNLTYDKLEYSIQFETKERKKRNFAWEKYSDGLNDFITFLKEHNKNDLIKLLNTNTDNIDECEILKKVKGLGPALLRDYLKELCRDDLIKDDIHIKSICEEYLGLKNKNLTKEFIALCNSINENPYYVDKILWLCCTGNFYKHGVVISKMSNRGNFTKFLKNNKISKWHY